MEKQPNLVGTLLLNQMQNKISWSRLNFETSYFLSYPKTRSERFSQHELYNFIESHPFLKNIRHSTSHIGILNLYKLTSLSPNDQISFENLFHNILNKAIHSRITKKEISKWRCLLNMHKEMISKVKTIRNKVIAHTDISKRHFTQYLYEDALSLLNTCQIILDEIIEIEHLNITADRVLEEDLHEINGYSFVVGYLNHYQ